MEGEVESRAAKTGHVTVKECENAHLREARAARCLVGTTHGSGSVPESRNSNLVVVKSAADAASPHAPQSRLAKDPVRTPHRT